ncbi:hypothetical protein GCM10009416_09990 [Craurococcus roseus]|uniref:Sel1 repeat family protein n=1 Tax=Craurococcus roseus TaxID=77585 RepID=A0ABP3PR63_9PROT
MNTLFDGQRSVTGGARPDEALLRVVAEMDPGWTVLRDCALGDGDDGVQVRVRYALLHPDLGIALLDLLPGATTPGAPNRLRKLLDAARFRSAFGDYPPIVYLCVPSRSLFGLNGLLVREFDLQRPLALAGGDAWVGAVQGVLTAEPPLCAPGQAFTETQPAFPSPLAARTGAFGDGAGRPAPRPSPGLRGLAVFWGVVGMAFGGGALILQSLGPPEASPAVAHARGTNRGEPEPPQPTMGVPEAWRAPSDSDKTRLPSPSPIFALWPAERMPVRFGAGAPETDGLALFDPGVDEDRSAAESAKPAPSPKSSAFATAGGASTGRDGAGGARDSLDEDSPRPVQADAAALPPAVAGGAGAAAASAAPEASTAGSDTGVLATEAETPQPFPGRFRDRTEPAFPPDAPALASPASPEVAPIAATPPEARGGEGAGSIDDPDAAPADPPGVTASPTAAAVQEPSSTAFESDGGLPARRSTASDDPPAPAGTPALTGTGPLPSGAAALATGSDDAPPPSAAAEQASEPSGAAGAPPVEDARDAARADPRGARTQEYPAGGSDAPPLGRVAEPEEVAGAVAAPVEAATPAVRGSTPDGESATPVPTPAVGALPMEPSAMPGTPVPQTAAVPPAGAAEPAPPSAVTPVARPAVQEPRGGAAPAGDTARRNPAVVSMPPSLVEALVSRGDAMMARRDISAARLLYERAAVAGNARAASALGRTYDPAFLAEIGARGISGDPALATAWYQKAISLGDGSAMARMDALGGPDSAARSRP